MIELILSSLFTKLEFDMQKTTSLLSLLLLLGIACLYSCDNSYEELSFEEGQAYFPIKSGTYAIYQIDSTIYSSFAEDGKAEVSLQLKEVYGDTFIDNEGRTAIEVFRYYRYDKTKDWSSITPIVWYAVKDETQAERMEGERRFIKLIFPIAPNRKWEGNKYLNTENAGKGWTNEYRLGLYDGWSYGYASINEPMTLGTLSFDETLTINQHDFDDRIDRLYGQEIYAKDVGLIYKEEWILRADDSFLEEPWPDNADKGHVVKIQITEYGVE